MAVLMQLNKEVVQHKVVLSEAPLTLGRDAANNLQIEDRTVSGFHARIEWVPGEEDTPGHHRIVDLDSTNGTFVNEEAVTSRRLAANDRLRLGLVNFLFATDEAVQHDRTARVHKSWIPGVYYTKD